MNFKATARGQRASGSASSGSYLCFLLMMRFLWFHQATAHSLQWGCLQRCISVLALEHLLSPRGGGWATRSMLQCSRAQTRLRRTQIFMDILRTSFDFTTTHSSTLCNKISQFKFITKKKTEILTSTFLCTTFLMTNTLRLQTETYLFD